MSVVPSSGNLILFWTLWVQFPNDTVIGWSCALSLIPKWCHHWVKLQEFDSRIIFFISLVTEFDSRIIFFISLVTVLFQSPLKKEYNSQIVNIQIPLSFRSTCQVVNLSVYQNCTVIYIIYHINCVWSEMCTMWNFQKSI